MNESNATTPIGEVVDGYFAMWNETDQARRREVIEATWTSDASYVDPMFDAEGQDALDAMVAGCTNSSPDTASARPGPSTFTMTARGGAGSLPGPAMARPSSPASTSPCLQRMAGCAKSPASSNSRTTLPDLRKELS